MTNIQIINTITTNKKTDIKNRHKNNSMINSNKLPMTQPVSIAYSLALIGYFGLIVLIPVWNLWWYPSENFSNLTLTIIWLVPLAFPLIGILKKNPYTFSWSGFIAVLYICHALTCLITNKDEIVPTLFELVLSSLFLFGSMYFTRWRNQQLLVNNKKSF